MTDAIESTLPSYTADRPRCSKCGNNKASTHYTPAGEPCGRLTRLTAVDVGERLCRTCDRCDHHWDEAVATREKAAPFRGRVPLGQQFNTEIVHEPGEVQLIIWHVPSGLSCKYIYPTHAGAEAGERPLWMFQGLLDQVDAWQREPIESPEGEAA